MRASRRGELENMGPSSRQPSRAGIPSFEHKLENEEEVLDAIVAALAREALEPSIWDELHDAATRDDRVSELAFAYESTAQGRKLKTQLPAVQAELYYRAASFFGDVLGDEFGATTYLERALAVLPGHVGAFERIDAQLTRSEDHRRLGELCVQTSSHRARPEQLALLERAADLFERASLEERSIETYQQLVRLEPRDERLRGALEERFVRANRYRDVARMLEQALTAEPPPEPAESARIRQRLIEIFAHQLKEPERSMPHVEALLEADPGNVDARRVAHRLLESRGLAARAAAALSAGAASAEERASYLAIELEHTRGPRRREVLRKIGLLKQDELGDAQGAFEAYEQALGIDPADDELRARFVALGCELKEPLEIARTFARISTVAKDTAVRSRITAEMGALLLRGGDAKRARTTLAGVLASPAADPDAVLTAARSLVGVHAEEGSAIALVEVLGRIAELSPDADERQRANEQIAELCSSELGDTERAIDAWRRLVDTPARPRALTQLEPLYEARGQWIDLSFVLEERAKDAADPAEQRALSFRAAEVLTTKTSDVASASEAWRLFVATHGPLREAYAMWIPLLEEQRMWPELAEALATDAALAPEEERASVLGRLGNVHLQRTRDAVAAIGAFAGALALDAGEKTSRAALEKLLLNAEQRLAAATVLEPVYRDEGDGHGLLRVLDIRAASSESTQERLAALEEAARVAEHVSKDKLVDFVARGLAEAVASGEPLSGWLERFRGAAEEVDPKRRAALLSRALGDRAVDSDELLALALSVGEESSAAGDIAAALAAYRRALAFAPTSAELIARVDQLLQEQGNPEERIALYRAALERGAEPQRRRQLLHSIGVVQRYELLELGAAIAAYRQAMAEDPSDRAAHEALVELYTETEAYDDLIALLEGWLARATSIEDARVTRAHLAEAAATRGQPELSALHAAALLDDAGIGEGELDLVERVAEALDDGSLLRRVLEERVRRTDDLSLHVASFERLAVLAQRSGDEPRAIVHLRQAAEAAEALGELDAAIAYYERLREMYPRDQRATTQLVALREARGHWREIPPLYSVLLELAADPQARASLLRRLARTLAERLDDLAGAFDATLSAFVLTPEDREVLAEATSLSVQAGRPEHLAEAIDEALAAMDAPARERQWAELTLAKARVLSPYEATWVRAAAAFREVLERAHDAAVTAPASEGLEALLRAMPRSETRTTELRWLHAWRVERAPAEGRPRALLAWAEAEEIEIGDEPAALDLYNQVLAIDDMELEALAAVSRLSLAHGDVEAALAALAARRAASEGDAKSTLDVQIATILADRPGRALEALDRLADVLERTPHDAAAIELAARLLDDEEVSARAAQILEGCLDSVEDAAQKIHIFDLLIAQSAPRRRWYERYLDVLADLDRPDEAYSIALRAVRRLPGEPALWDRAEHLARQASLPEPLADAYEEVLRPVDGDASSEGAAGAALADADALEVGQRAVAFFEEWYEDGSRVVRVLERMLEIDPADLWAFDRLKLIFDAQERWDDLFALYDRAAADADEARRIDLFEEAAQIAKDFANHAERAIDYFEKLLALRPGNARLMSALERLYERHGYHRELITLRGVRLEGLPHAEAQEERARIAELWMDALDDPSSALIVIEDIVASEAAARSLEEGEEVEAESVDVTPLLERVLATAPVTADIRETVPPPPGGRRDSYVPTAPQRGLVRQRAAALLKARYAAPGKEADLARVLEVELEVVKSVEERVRRHQQIAAIYAQLGQDDEALEHVVQLVMLEPEVGVHREELAALAARTGRFDRLAEVLVSAAEDANDDALEIELLMSAGDVNARSIDDVDRAIELYFRVLSLAGAAKGDADAALLEACRRVEPLLERAGRRGDRLTVLERLAALEHDPDVRWHVLGEAARLAMSEGEDERAIFAWEGRLEARALDPEALDGLVSLFEKAERHRPLIDALSKRATRADRSDEERRADRVLSAEIASERLGLLDEAIATWREVEDTFGSSEDGTRALADLYRRTERWDDLAELLGAAAERAATPGDRAELLRELGDVQREQLEELALAINSYELSLTAQPSNEGARAGLRALLDGATHRGNVVRVLLAAYGAADDWALTLELTEHRLAAAEDAASQIAVLREAARISEERADDAGAAFVLARRALLLDPADDHGVAELFRLAEASRNHRALADALRECISQGEALPWAHALRFRMGEVLETHLDDARAALEAFAEVAERDPTDLEARRAVIRAAGKCARWDAAASALVDATRARSAVEQVLLDVIEEAATAAAGWDAITAAVGSLVHDGAGLAPELARDLEETIAVWHRDRRGDPDAAEAAYARALSHDSANAALLGELAQLQRRARGRPLVDSLLRLSQTTGGDLDLLDEAAEVATSSVGDRALARSIFERLHKLATERWLGGTGDDDAALTSGAPRPPDAYVERATRELVRIYGDDGDHEKAVQLLSETAQLPWTGDQARSLLHGAARAAVEKLGAVERAIEIYLGLVASDPHDARAVEALVALYERDGRRHDLRALKRRLVGTARERGERLALRLEVAALDDELAEPEGAVAALRENLEEAARHEGTVRMLASLLEREGRVADLETLFASQAELAEADGDPLAADYFGRAAEVAERQLSDAPRAMAHLRRVIALEPRPLAYDALARLATDARAFDEAAGYLDRLRELSSGPERAAVTLRLADALVAAGRGGDARERLESELEGDPEADDVRVRLADTYRAAEDWQPLADLLTAGAHYAPDKATRLARLCEAAELHRFRRAEPDRAVPLLEQAVDLAPEENAVRLALSGALGAAGRFDEARSLLRALVEGFGGRRPKERAPVHYHLAQLDLAVGDRARALVELDAATRIDPANPEILRALAELARDDGQLDRAERSYRALLTVLRRQEAADESAPITRSEVMFELSQIAARQGEPERASEILESALELSAEGAVEARRLERALRSAGDHATLARALSSRLERGEAADEAAIRIELGTLYDAHLDRKDEALSMLLGALDLAPADDDAHDAALRLAAAAGDLAAYEARVRALAESHQASGAGGELAGALYQRLGRIAETERADDLEAAGLYEEAVSLRPRDRELLGVLAGVYERLGDDAGQARVLGIRVELDVETGSVSPDALYRLAHLHFRSGDADAGCDAFERAFDAEPNLDRGEELLRAAADAHPEAERVLDWYERLAREPGRERSLVDALVLRWSLPGSGAEPMREAVEVANALEDAELAESLLRRFLEARGDEADAEDRVWALGLLAFCCEESGRFREAAVLKREAAELAGPEAARRLLYEVAGLASGPLEDLRLAASIYEELHEQDPHDRDAWELLLDVYRRLDEHSKLIELLARVVELVDDPGERSRMRLDRVKLRIERQELSDDEAAVELEDILDEHPGQVDAAILLGTIFERSGREDDLAGLLARQIDAAKDREDAEAVGSLSRRLGQLLEDRDRAQALDVYYAALNWDPAAREILLALERLHGGDADIEARSEVMERRLAIERGDEAEALALALYDTRVSLDDPDAALRALEIGFEAAPRSAKVRDRLEAAYRERGEHMKLADLFVLDARGRPDPRIKCERLREAARLYRDELADPQRAAEVLREARSADPSHSLALLDLVDTLSAAGELRSASDELTSAIEPLEPDDPLRPDLVGRRALVRSRLHEMDEALADFEDAVAHGKAELRPYLVEHLGNMALRAAGRGEDALWRAYRLRIAALRVELDDLEGARDVLTELLKTDSKDKATLRAIAHVDELEGRWDAASATYRRLVGLEEGGEIVSAALRLLDACKRAGRLGDARGGLERARLAAPEDAELRDRLAWLYGELGARRELAELVLEEARAAGDVAPRFEGLLRAGQLFLEAEVDAGAQQPDLTNAIVPLEEAHALRPADLDCVALLADAYTLGGRTDDAQELLLRIIGTFKGRRARELSALYHRLARVAQALGDREAEVQHLTTALDMDAQNGVVASELAYAAMELGTLDVAQRALRQITMLKAAAPVPKALAYQHLGEIARHQGDMRRAMMLAKRAVDEDPMLDSARLFFDQLQAES